MIGHTLGHYRIVEKVGAGGMGEVYRAEDLHLRRDVAIKVLPVGTLADDHARKCFRKEAEALSKLNHPSIQTIHDFSTEDGIDFLVSEYVAGITLNERLAAKGLPLKEVLRFGQQMAEGLAAAHEEGIVHRDVKPSNLRITPDGRLKILDFGVAKLGCDTLATQTLTETQSIAGTPLYMAPEQKLGESVDARADIYSAGLVLREMVTGNPPRSREVFAPTGCPPRLQQIIEKCLEKEPENRYQSARELAVDLRRVAILPSAPNVASLPAPAWGRPASVIAAVAAVVSITAVLIGLNVGRVRERLSRGFHVADSRPRIESLAVLPFGNLSRDANQEYFTDGMTEAVIADLAKIKAMKVISRTSVMSYKNSGKSMREIATELHADAVIEGSVMRADDRVRITVELIDASSDQHLWGDSYERDLKNILTLQGEVAQAIAQQVRAVITPQEQVRLVKGRPMDPQVYELYLKGRHIMERGGLEDVQKAIDYFQSGLAKDPDNPLLYTGLADAYIDKMMDVHESPVEATAKARAAAAKALQLDDSLAEAHTSLGTIKLSYDWDWDGAEHEFSRAMQLNPSYPLAYIMYGQYLTMIGRQADALPYFEKAHRLDPLLGESYRGEGYSCYMGHKYDEAIVQYRKALELEPDAITYFGLVLARAENGDSNTAIAEAEKATKLNASPLLLTSLASAYARAGRPDDANRVLRRLDEVWKRRGTAPAWHTVNSPYVCPYEVAGVYAQLGDKDRALEWLDRAYRNRSCLYWLRQDPRFDSIRSDARFQELLAKINFPQ